MKVRFIRDELFENEGRLKGVQYRAGEVYDFADDFAQRWIRRGAVEEARDPPAVASPPPAPAAPKAIEIPKPATAPSFSKAGPSA